MQPAAVHTAGLRTVRGEPPARALALHRCSHAPVLPQEVGSALCLAFLILLTVGRLEAQDLTALTKPYDWGAGRVWDPAWSDPGITTTEVLEDDLAIRIRNTKPEFIALFFERRKVIRFADESGIRDHGRVVLPESLDPVYDRSQVPWAERDEPAHPRWLNVRLDHFAARVVRPDGSWEELAFLHRMEDASLRTLQAIETAWRFVLDVQDIRPGDVVELRWKYMIPYDYNWPNTRGWRGLQWMDNWARLTSWRVFFHGTLPVRHQRVELLYDLRHGLLLSGAPPDQRVSEGREVRAVWEQVGLPGCIDEVGARPAQDLPHIVVQFVPEDFRYWRRDRLSGLPFEQPYWLQVARFREARADWWRRVARKRIPDRQNQLIKEFVQRVGGSEGLLIDRMARIHDHIARHFTYDDDHLWYLDLDKGNARLGDQVRDGVIRDRSRYDLYAKLVYALGMRYATAYLLDHRVGAMNDSYLTPLWDSEFLVGVRQEGRDLWMHPKRGQQGLLAGELPFYWQGTSALLIDLPMLLEDLPPPPLFIDLPVEDPQGHVRGVEYTLDIDPAGGRVDGEVRVFLSGQFSTLGRAAYQGAPIDSTVDPLYGWKPTDVVGLSASAWTNSTLSNEPPFRFRSEARFKADQLIEWSGDSTFTIDLTRFMAHVTPAAFDADDRVLPYYWDFMQQDRFRFELRSVQALEVLGPSMERVDGPGCSIETRVFQRGANSVLVDRVFRVDQERVDADGMNALAQVIDASRAALVVRFRVRERLP